MPVEDAERARLGRYYEGRKVNTMTKAEIKAMMIEQIKKTFYELRDENIEDMITEEDVYEYLWKHDYDHLLAEEKFNKNREDYIEEYLDEIYDEIDVYDLED